VSPTGVNGRGSERRQRADDPLAVRVPLRGVGEEQAVVLDRLDLLACRVVDPSKLIMRRGVVRVELERLLELGSRVGQSPGIVQEDAVVEAQDGILGLEVNGHGELGEGGGGVGQGKGGSGEPHMSPIEKPRFSVRARWNATCAAGKSSCCTRAMRIP
jgi:hypothetical protein